MGRRNKDFSQLPYAVRLQIRKAAEIQQEREDSAMRMIMSILEAMHDNEGYGLQRLVRYAVQFKKLIVEFYADREYMEDQVKRRLAQHNVDVGDAFDRYDPGHTKAEHIAAEGLDAARVALAIGLITANDVAGLGADRLADLIEKTQEILFDRMISAKNEKKHNENLERIGFVIENGAVVIWQDENGDVVHRRKAERENR